MPKSFAEARPITTNNESQRFEAIGFDKEGTVFAAWLDKRNRVPAQQSGKKYDGATVLCVLEGWRPRPIPTQGWRSTTPANAAASGSPSIRRTIPSSYSGTFSRAASAITPSSRLPMRQTPGAPRRVSVYDWQIAVCPHHGPSLAISENGTYHVSLVHQWQGAQGIVLCPFHAMAAKASPRRWPSARSKRNPSRPFLLAGPHGLALVWKEFDGERTTVNLMTSADDGQTWTSPRAIAETSDSDRIIRCW